MNRTILVVAILLGIGSGTASAQAPGVNLSWDDCFASTNGGLNQTSACNSNTETQKNIYGSYVLPLPGADALAGNDIVINIMTNSATLPCWWNFAAAPRISGYQTNFTTPCPSNAFDYWGSVGGVVGGSAVFLQPTAATPRIQIKAVVAIPADRAAPVPAEMEIYSFTLVLRFNATVGTCTGCATSACIGLDRIRVTQIGFPYYELWDPSSRRHVLWQGGVIAPPGCPLAVPTQNKTWGSVKAMYR